MAKKTIQEAFGSSVVTPNPADPDPSFLLKQGHYPDLSKANTVKAQGWIVALLNRWLSYFPVSNRVANPDETITVSNDGDALRTEGSITYRVTTFRIQIFRTETAFVVDPDDY